jgi:glycosyltransferase involved in cell wall biosynthesis
VTYNHVKYIEQTIKSFLVQKTSFSYEIIIHDDASTDGTAEIIKRYADKYPERIVAILQKVNQWKEGMLSGKFYGYEPFTRNVLPIVKGKYIALCEGDDYWTDPTKLQKQFDYMESHPECVMCYHTSRMVFENGKSVIFGKEGKDFSEDEMIATPTGIATATKMFRNLYSEKTKQDFINFSGDCLLSTYLGIYGRCGYVYGIKPSVYRVHSEGVWSRKTRQQKKVALYDMYDILYKLFLEKGNEHHIKIREKQVVKNRMFGIVIATYQRSDGKTPFYLKRTLDSIFAQTYKEFIIYIVGDRYEDEQELLDIVSKYPGTHIDYENRPEAPERDKYVDNKEALWCAGGVSATNYGIEKAMVDRIRYICLLDHDDYWLPNHLDTLNKAIQDTDAEWLCTKTSVKGTVHGKYDFLPNKETKETLTEFLPLPCGIVKSSVCFDIRSIPFRMRDVFAEIGETCPGDADLWDRTSQFIQYHKLSSYYINTLTCVHDSEGYVRYGGLLTKTNGNKKDITVITCTGDRPEAFALLQRWMKNQMMVPKQWIVVDDGIEPLYPVREYEYIRREPTKDDYAHTLCLNFERALENVKYDKIIVMEDDDWYSPVYIDYMSQLLDKADLVGLGNLIFYYPSIRKYMEKATVKQPAFAQTAFRKNLIPIIKQICDGASKDFDLCGKGLIDSKLWAHSLDIYKRDRAVRLTTSLKIANGHIVPKGTIFRDPIPGGIIRRAEKKNGAEYIHDNVPAKAIKMIVKCDKYLSVGMKGMPGRAGKTSHQNKENRKYKEDINYNLLKSILKSDANYYLELFA